MSTLPEQISAARKAQLEAQMDFFQNLTAKSLESVQKILALNLSASRASMEKSSSTVAQLLTVKDPRDLFALTNTSQASLQGMLAYSRELFAIATGTGAALSGATVKVAAEVAPEVRPEVAHEVAHEIARAAAPVKEAVEQEQAAQELQEWTEPEPAAAELIAPVTDPEPALEESMSAPVAPPEAETTPIAKAVSKVASKSVAAKPAAAPVPAVKKATVVTGIKPVDATPPPASAKAALSQPQQQDVPAAKAKKRK